MSASATWIVAVVLALLAASCFAVCTVMQHRESQRVPVQGARLLVRLLRRPWFLVSGVVEVAGISLQALAVGIGTVVLVQPLLVCGLLLAVVLSAVWDRRSLAAGEVVGAGACVVGLGLFLAVARPSVGGTKLVWSQAWPVALALLVAAGLAVVAGRLFAAQRGPLLGLTSGLMFGLAAGPLKVVAHHLHESGLSGLWVWETPVLVVLGVIGTSCAQNAFQADALGRSLAVLTLAEPVAAVIFGAIVLHEALRSSPVDVIAEVVGAAVAVAGVGLLAFGLAGRQVTTPARVADDDVVHTCAA